MNPPINDIKVGAGAEGKTDRDYLIGWDIGATPDKTCRVYGRKDEDGTIVITRVEYGEDRDASTESMNTPNEKEWWEQKPYAVPNSCFRDHVCTSISDCDAGYEYDIPAIIAEAERRMLEEVDKELLSEMATLEALVKSGLDDDSVRMSKTTLSRLRRRLSELTKDKS